MILQGQNALQQRLSGIGKGGPDPNIATTLEGRYPHIVVKDTVPNDENRSAKTDPVRFKWGFGEGSFKDNLPFSRLLKILYPRGESSEKLLAKHPF